MTSFDEFILKAIRKLYSKANQESAFGRNWKMFPNKEYSNELIYKLLIQDQPSMIARLGAVELGILVNYLGVKNKDKNYLKFIKGKAPEWWWNKSLINSLRNNAGFFPTDLGKIEQFCKLIIEDIFEVDVLGSWLKEEAFFNEELIGAKRVVLEDLEPFFCSNPWTRALEGKKVLVVHPFSETIEKQYKKRNLLFDDSLLPHFDLKTIKAVQSVAGEKTQYADWFEALNWMKSQIEEVDFDICIVGCGAYGFPLAAHVKRMGKKAVHLAGATQLLFGIKGKRWEEYIVWPYTNLFNEHWVRPGEKEKPKNAVIVEGACYW